MYKNDHNVARVASFASPTSTDNETVVHEGNMVF